MLTITLRFIDNHIKYKEKNVSQTANRVIKNTGYLYAKMAITMFVSLYTTRLILNSLGASDFGIYNIVGGVISMLGFLNAAMASSTQRFMNYAEGEGNNEKKVGIFNVSVVLHVFVAAIVVVMLLLAGFLFFNGILNIPEGRMFAAKVVYGSLIISTMVTILTVPYDAVLNSHENMKYYSIVGVLESLLKLAVAFACVYTSQDKLIVYGLLMAAIPFVSLFIMAFYCHKNYSECSLALRKNWDRKTAKDMTGFAGWGFLGSTSSLLCMQGVSILLNMFGGVIANAAHGIANQLAGQLMVFSNNMLKALNPVLVKSRGAGETEKMIEAASTGNKLSFIIYTFFAIPFIIECPYILSIWLKNVPEYAVLFVRLVLIRQMISQLMVTLETCISATGRIRNYTIASSCIWLFPICIGYLLYKIGTPIETIYWLLIVLVCVRILNALCFCRKLCGMHVSDYVRCTLLPCLFIGLLLFLMLVCLTAVADMSFGRLVLSATATLVFYPVLAYYCGLNAKERGLVGSAIKRIRQRGRSKKR